MFHYIKGELTYADPSFAVIETGGVGYKMTVSYNTFAKIGSRIGEKLTLYTYMSVREDAIELMGFMTVEELNVFKMLITVSGVGPKAAMAILSAMTPEKFAYSVGISDYKALAKANGVGTKTAQRIVLELKDKVAKELSQEQTDAPEQDAYIPSGGNTEEAVKALMVLGYNRSEAMQALTGVNTNDTLENMITAALKKMASRL